MTADTLTITFDPPISFNGGTIAPLQLREPTGKEILEAEKEIASGVTPESFTAYQVTLVSGVTGLTAEALEELPNSKFKQAYDFLQAFDQIKPKAVEPSLDTLTLPFPKPLTHAGVSYEAITLREPTLGARRRAESRLRPDSNPATRRGYQMVLIAAASDVPFAAVEMMPVSLLNAAETFLRGFIDGGRRSGSA